MNAKEIIKEQYESRYGTQRYSDSNLRHTFEGVVLKCMDQFAKDQLIELRDNIQIQLIEKQLPSNARLLSQTVALINSQIKAMTKTVTLKQGIELHGFDSEQSIMMYADSVKQHGEVLYSGKLSKVTEEQAQEFGFAPHGNYTALESLKSATDKEFIIITKT